MKAKLKKIDESRFFADLNLNIIDAAQLFYDVSGGHGGFKKSAKEAAKAKRELFTAIRRANRFTNRRKR